MSDPPLPDSEDSPREPEVKKQASTTVGLILAAMLFALFAALFVQALEKREGENAPAEAPRVEGQFAPLGNTTAITVIASDDEDSKKKKKKKRKVDSSAEKKREDESAQAPTQVVPRTTGETR